MGIFDIEEFYVWFLFTHIYNYSITQSIPSLLSGELI